MVGPNDLNGGPVLPAGGDLPVEGGDATAPLFDRVIDKLVGWWDVACTWVPLALAICASPGVFVWPLFFGETAHLLDNDLAMRETIAAAVAVGVSLLVLGGFYLAMALRAERPWSETFRIWNERLLPLLILPIVPLLAAPGVESKSPWFVLLSAAGVGAIAGLATYRRPLSLERLPAWLPGSMAALLTVGWAVQMSLFAIGQHHALLTNVYDLGIYDSIFWHSAHGEPLATELVRGGNHVSAHVDPILVLLSPLYLLYPRAETILVLQAVWGAAGAIPAWLLGKRLLGRWYGLAFALIYLLQPTLQGRTLYDFHSLTLAGPILLWCMACLELGWLRRFWVAFALLLLTREDMAMLACMIGVYALLGKGHRRLGASAIVLAIVYLAFVKLVVMPEPGLLMNGSKEAYGYSFYYKDLIPHGGMGVGGLLLSLATNPVFVLQHVVTVAKLQFFAIVFLPLLLLPFVAPRGRLLLAYGMIFIFLASRGPVFSPGFQYATLLDALALGLAVIALSDLPGLRFKPWARLDPARMRPALAVAMLGASVVISAKFGAFVPNDAFRAGFGKLHRAPTEATVANYAWVREMVERIGPDASVSSIGRLGPHVSNRGNLYHFPEGMDSDFLFLDRRTINADQRKRVDQLVKDGRYLEVGKRAQFVLLEKNADFREKPAMARPKAELLRPAGVSGDRLKLPDLVRPELQKKAVSPSPPR